MLICNNFLVVTILWKHAKQMLPFSIQRQISKVGMREVHLAKTHLSHWDFKKKNNPYEAQSFE